MTPDGCLIFDDTVLDKRYAKEIALAKQQYSGNARRTINGIGIVTCVYVNPRLDRYWLIDYRIYDKPNMTVNRSWIMFAAYAFGFGKRLALMNFREC